MMTIELILIYAVITILSCVLLLGTLLSYLRYRNKKLLFVSCVFLILFLRGILLSISLVNTTVATLMVNGYIWLFDIAILLFLYTAYSLREK
ncbi:MAG: hypothetical protein V1726_00125 [Methanobacteriota archaeon]